MTLKDEIIEMLRKSKNGLTIESITRKSSVTKHHSRVGNVLSSMQQKGDVYMDQEGRWHLGQKPLEQMERDEAIAFLDKLAANFHGIARDVIRVRDLLKKGAA